jgi:hypothetical protein
VGILLQQEALQAFGAHNIGGGGRRSDRGGGRGCGPSLRVTRALIVFHPLQHRRYIATNELCAQHSLRLGEHGGAETFLCLTREFRAPCGLFLALLVEAFRQLL